MPGDYRIFVGAFPGGEFAARVQAVRREWDPLTARITPPHVTLAGTYWRSGPPLAASEAAAISRLRDLETRLARFELVLGGLRTFPNDPPVVYLGIEMSSALMEARRMLLSILGTDKHREFTPHLTLAMRLPPARVEDMLAALEESDLHRRRFRVPIEELRLMQRGPEDALWRSIATFKLRS